MVAHPALRWIVRAGLLLLTAGLIAGALNVLLQPPRDLLASQLLADLTSAPVHDVDLIVGHLEALDERGTTAMVAALGSPRTEVAQAARLALHRQLDRWQRLPLNESIPRINLLARALACHVEQFPPAARRAASDLAARALKWPVSHPPRGDRPQLFADCEKTVRTAAELPRQDNPLAHPTAAADVTAQSSMHRTSSAADGPTYHVATEPDLPGGGLPVAESDIPPVPPSLTERPRPRPVDPDEPDLLPAPEPTVPRPLFPDAVDDDHQPTNPILPYSDGLRTFERVSPPHHQATQSAATSQTPPHDHLKSLADLDLMKRLHDRDPAVAQVANHQLRNRGFSQNDVSLASRLTDPDVVRRRQFVEALATAPFEPIRWLVWSSQDPDPSVRRIAVGMMATTRHPTLNLRLSQMVHVETDKDVRRQLELWQRFR
ncbi:MAG: hypothetical protein FJ276_16875 [Planctomycetes bacterium]|nr:hypothetical protein [Planctomycetota bacterium]